MTEEEYITEFYKGESHACWSRPHKDCVEVDGDLTLAQARVIVRWLEEQAE